MHLHGVAGELTLVKRRIKRVALAATRSVGAFHVLRRTRWRRKRLLLLCYHGVSLADEHFWNPDLYLSSHDLEWRLKKIIQGKYNILTLSEAVARLYDGTLPDAAAALTFDDGFYDFHARALPLLRRYGLPATVYQTTYHCDDQRPIFALACRYMLWSRLGRIDREAEAVWIARGEGKSAAAKDEIAAELAARIGFDYAALKRRRILTLMTPEEVADVARDPLVDVQLHTHRHRTPRDWDLFRREIEDNRRRLEALTGPGKTHFCYPSGVTAPEFPGWLRHCGVATATTCRPGLASPGDDPLLLPRFVDTSSTTPLEFEAWLAGAGELMAAAGRRLPGMAAEGPGAAPAVSSSRI